MSESKEQINPPIPKSVQNEFSRWMSDVKDARFESDKLFSVTGGDSIVFREYVGYFFENGSQWPHFKLRALLQANNEGINSVALYEERRFEPSLAVTFPGSYNSNTSVRLDRGSGELYIEYREDGQLVHASFEPHKPADVDEEPKLDLVRGNWIYKSGDESSYDEGQTYEKGGQMVKTKRDGDLIRAERIVNGEVVDMFVMPEQIDVESISSELFPRSLRKDVFGAPSEDDERWTQSSEVLDALGVDWQIHGDEDSERTEKMKEYWEKLMKDIDQHDGEN